ncbi:MAG: ion channel, partial [Actinomycetota bacterium]|nr:ion channel [Actinomycetota bacterium]
MGAVLAVFGVGLLALALGDAITTTIRISRRGGPVTRLVSGVLWRALSRLRRRPTWLPPFYFAGLVVTLSVVAFWIAAIIGGWFLLFSSSPGAIVDTLTGQPVDAVSRLYFAGYTVFTLGIGDIRPSGAVWKTCTWLAAGSGLFLTTLAITYIIPLTTSASQKRQLARLISGLGRDPADVVTKGWSGGDFRALEGWLLSLTPMLTRLAE